MRALSLTALLLGGCLWSSTPDEISLAEATGLELEVTGHLKTQLWIRLRDVSNQSNDCPSLRSDLHAELGGLAMVVDRGGSLDIEHCQDPKLTLDAIPAGIEQTLVLADGSRTITVAFGERLAMPTIEPPGPYGLVGGQTFTFRNPGPHRLPLDFEVLVRTSTLWHLLDRQDNADGSFSVTMPAMELDGGLVFGNGGPPIVTTSIGGVTCVLPSNDGIVIPLHLAAPMP